MVKYVSIFAIVTLLPAVLLLIASTQGGVWSLAPLLLLGTVSHVVDELFENRPNTPVEHHLKTILPVTISLLHFILLATAVLAITFQPFALGTKIALFFGYALYFANVSNAAAHELIHRTNRITFNLGKWMFISILFGHHTSSHRLIHHPYVATALRSQYSALQ